MYEPKNGKMKKIIKIIEDTAVCNNASAVISLEFFHLLLFGSIAFTIVPRRTVL